METEKRSRIFRPDDCLTRGFSLLWAEIFSEIRTNGWLIWQLFKRDFLALYKQSFIGVLWAVILPVVSVGTFILLNHAGIFTYGTVNAPYPIYAVTGMALWQVFSVGLISTTSSLVKAGSMIVKINFSRKSLVIASLGHSLIAFMIQLVVVALLCAVYGYPIGLAWLLLPLLLMPLLALTLGLGFVFAILNGIVRDFGNLVSILITFLLFLTPVLYPFPTQGVLARISQLNPLSYLVSVPRDFILGSANPAWSGFVLMSCISLVFVFMSVYIFHIAEPRIAERI